MSKSTFWQDIIFPGDIADLRVIGTGGLIVPQGATIQRPSSPANGTIRYDVTLGGTEIYQNGAWSQIQTTALGGEVNTASSLGSGQTIFAGKVGNDLQFKSLVAGANVTLGVGPNSVTINAPGVGEANTTSNIGLGSGEVFSTKLGTDFQLRTLNSLSPNLSITTLGSEVNFDLVGLAAGGEVNTGTNAGAGSQIFKDKVGLNLRLRSLLGTTNQIDATQSTDTIQFALADNPVIPGNESIRIPIGSTALEPAATNGMLRYDSDTHQIRGVINGAWQTLTTAVGTFLQLGGGTMTGDINLDATANIIGAVGSNVILQDDIIMTAGANMDMSAGGNVVMTAAATVDGRDVSMDGAQLDQINQTGVFGIPVRTADGTPGTFVYRTIAGTANQTTISNGDGVAGAPTVALADNPVLGGTEALTIPVGLTAGRPAISVAGQTRINSDLGNIEYYAGGTWQQPLNVLGGTMAGSIDMGGFDLSNVNLTDGRDLTADGVVIDGISSLVDNTGVVVRNGGVFATQLITASTGLSTRGASVVNGDGSAAIEIGVDITGRTVTPTLATSDEVMVYNVATGENTKSTISDITALLSSSGLASELDPTGQFGFLTRIADGSPGTFARRNIFPSVVAGEEGLVVANTDGVAGNPTVGLNINGLTATTIVDDGTIGLVYGQGSGSNFKVTQGVLRENFLNGPFRVSVTGTAVPSGLSQVPFSIGVGDFDTHSRFSDVADSYTPLAGTYKIGAYVEVDNTTTAGRYVVSIRRNGVAEGNRGVVVSDATNVDTTRTEDLFVANGTDVFTVEINNLSGAAATLPVVRFYAHRAY